MKQHSGDFLHKRANRNLKKSRSDDNILERKITPIINPERVIEDVINITPLRGFDKIGDVC